MFLVIREVKFDVTWPYAKRQTPKMTSEFVFFSSNPSLNHINIEKCLLLLATNTNIFTLLFNELKTDGNSFIFAVCRLTYDHVKSNLISLLLYSSTWQKGKNCITLQASNRSRYVRCWVKTSTVQKCIVSTIIKRKKIWAIQSYHHSQKPIVRDSLLYNLHNAVCSKNSIVEHSGLLLFNFWAMICRKDTEMGFSNPCV